MYKMNTETKKYVFKTDIGSVYQMFWVTHDILNMSPNTDLDFDIKETTTLMFVTNSNLSYSQIQFILNDNLIEYEKMS